MKNTSNLVIIRGGVASGKVFLARQMAEQDGRVVIDMDLLRNRDNSSKIEVVREHLQAGRKIVVADVLPLNNLRCAFPTYNGQADAVPPQGDSRPA